MEQSSRRPTVFSPGLNTVLYCQGNRVAGPFLTTDFFRKIVHNKFSISSRESQGFRHRVPADRRGEGKQGRRAVFALLNVVVGASTVPPSAVRSTTDLAAPECYHRMRALPQVRPPPKTGRQTISSFFMLPSRTASSRAIAHDAEEMFPYLWRVT